MHWKQNPDLYPPHLRTRIRRGKGVGHGLEYGRWLNIRDVPSRGTSSSVTGIHVRRPYHLLSELETTYFFLVERQPSTVDIQEQWPILDLDRTLTLCTQSGVRHPFRGAYPEPFTIDFLITERIDGAIQYRAASIKTPEDAADPAVRQRLSIELTWCRERGIPWTLVDTSAFNKTLLANLRFMRAWFANHYEPNSESLELFAQKFDESYRANVLLDELILRVAKRQGLATQLARNMFLYCVWSDRISLALEHSLSLNRPLVLRRLVNRD